jgi:hypothetical protein
MHNTASQSYRQHVLLHLSRWPQSPSFMVTVLQPRVLIRLCRRPMDYREEGWCLDGRAINPGRALANQFLHAHLDSMVAHEMLPGGGVSVLSLGVDKSDPHATARGNEEQIGPSADTPLSSAMEPKATLPVGLRWALGSSTTTPIPPSAMRSSPPSAGPRWDRAPRVPPSVASLQGHAF